jgi:hypothetical protein
VGCSRLKSSNTNSAAKIQNLDSSADVLTSISNDKSLAIFNTIALTGGDSSILISKINLTRKQYYSRLNSLTWSGLIRKEKRKHFLTSFGKIVYDAEKRIGKAINNSWKLKAIDSIGTSGNLPLDEHLKIINSIIDDEEIKEILLSKSTNPPVNEAATDRCNLTAAHETVRRYVK